MNINNLIIIVIFSVLCSVPLLNASLSPGQTQASGLGQTFISSTSPSSQTMLIPREISSCEYTQRCKEIDETWTGISSLIGGEGKNKVWRLQQWGNFQDE